MDLFANLKSSDFIAACKRLRHKIKRRALRNVPVLREAELQSILINDLGIKNGGSFLVHCGFGYLNTELSPDRMIRLLQDIVGPEGNILMPYYPPGMSLSWARAGRCFDLAKTDVSTGELSKQFGQSENVVLSQHPIKSLAAWGADAVELVATHSDSLHPFDHHSPYFKLSLIENSMTIGLGVRNCSLFHCAEDVYEIDKSYLYEPEVYSLIVRNKDGTETTVRTFVHHSRVKLMPSWDFFDIHLPSLPTVIKRGLTTFYSLNNRQMMAKVGRLLRQGVNRRPSL